MNSSDTQKAEALKPVTPAQRVARQRKLPAKKLGGFVDNTGQMVTLYCGDLEAMPEMVGCHLGPRTKWEYPYSYDPILQFRSEKQPTGSAYSDRLRSWYSSEKMEAAKKRHFGGLSDYYSGYSPAKIEAFLRDLMDKPNLELCRVEEHCNQATGYPVWYFAFCVPSEEAPAAPSPQDRSDAV